MSRPGLPVARPSAPVPPNATVRPEIRRGFAVGLVTTAFGLATLALVRAISDSAGLTGAVLGALAASTAIGLVVPVFLWVDRLEAEPVRLMWFSFAWGALISTVGALVLNGLGVSIFAGLEVDPLFAGAVLVAPVTEEALKCLGVLLIFWRCRQEFNGVADGIAYAGVTAAGFAFVENILYLGSSYSELGTQGLVWVFILRCLMSPFAHPMFTVCFGLALGLIAHRRQKRYAVVPLVGFAAAVFLHGLWNFAAVSTGAGYFVTYAVVQVPLFLAFVAILVWARRCEAAMVRDHLTVYGLNGWFTPAEVAMISSPAERRRARERAGARGGPSAERAMRAFQDEAAELAVARHHLTEGDHVAIWQERERRLLTVLPHHRAAFSTAPAPTPR